MRLITLLPLFFFGCANPADDSVDATDAALAPAPAGPTVKVAFEGENTVIYAYPIRLDDEGNPDWIGSALASGTVKDGLAALTLPARAPARDKDSAHPNNPIFYFFFDRQLDESGTPAEFLGVSTDQLAYFNGKDKKRSGWYVMTPREGKPAFASTDRIVQMDDGIRPSAGVTLSGKVGSVGPGDVKLGFEYDKEPVASEDWTAEMNEEFTFQATGLPPEGETLDDGSVSSTLIPHAFLDENEDGVWAANEASVGSICAGANSVVVTYLTPATQLERAFLLARGHEKTGWNAFATSEDGLRPVPADAEFVAHGDCAEAFSHVEFPDGNVEPGEGDSGSQP